ncbi:MAG: LamG domain-containing protein [Thermofilaceae archaeon]
MSARRALRAGGLWFDGKGSYASVKSEPYDELDPAAVTLCAWVYLPRYPLTLYGIIVGRHNRFPYAIRADADGYFVVGFTYAGGTYTVEPANYTIPLNRWVFLCASYDGETLRAYANGELVKSWVIGKPLQRGTNFDVLIGSNATDWHTLGIIADVRVYNRALTADEIKAIYERGELIRDGLVLHLDFTEGKGSVAYDKSGCGNHATIYGARWVVKKALRVLQR